MCQMAFWDLHFWHGGTVLVVSHWPLYCSIVIKCRFCITDAVSNVTMARQGFPRMAVGACFGSPLMSILTYG